MLCINRAYQSFDFTGETVKVNRGIKIMDIKKRIIYFILGSCFIVPFFVLPLNAQETILPEVKDFSGMSLMEALKNRRTSRNFSKKIYLIIFCQSYCGLQAG